MKESTRIVKAIRNAPATKEATKLFEEFVTSIVLNAREKRITEQEKHDWS